MSTKPGKIKRLARFILSLLSSVLRTFWSSLPFLVAIATWWCFLRYLRIKTSDIARAGQLGDSFGTINALFSSLAAVAAFKAYWSQRNQLIDQKTEFAAQRHESHLFFLMEELRQAVRGVTYNATREDENGEPVPIELVNQMAVCHLENTLLGTLVTSVPSVPLSSASASLDRPLSFIARERCRLFFNQNAKMEALRGEIDDQLRINRVSSIPSFPTPNLRLRLERQVIAEQFHRFYEECAGAPLGNVFRLQAAILRYIDNPSIPEQQRIQHAELFKAQISDPELHLLLYYALSDIPRDNLRDIMSRYNILEALWRKKPQFIWHRIPEISYFESPEGKAMM